MSARTCLTRTQLRSLRSRVLRNLREHCSQVYRKNGKREACRTAAAIAAAEISDVLEELFGVRI